MLRGYAANPQRRPHRRSPLLKWVHIGRLMSAIATLRQPLPALAFYLRQFRQPWRRCTS